MISFWRGHGTDDPALGKYFDFFLGFDGPLDPAVDGNADHVDIGFDFPGFTDDQAVAGKDLAFKNTVDPEIFLEFDIAGEFGFLIDKSADLYARLDFVHFFSLLKIEKSLSNSARELKKISIFPFPDLA